MEPFKGALYDGNGKRLDGDGPESALDLMATIGHKAFLHDGPTKSETFKFSEKDRLLLVADDFAVTKTLSLGWILDLAVLLTKGGCVGVMSGNEASVAAVVKILSAPDALLAGVRAATDLLLQPVTTAGTESLGMLADGTGAYIDGDQGQAVRWQTDEKMQFKAFMNGGAEAGSRAHLVPSDRFYMMPSDYETRRALPLWIMGELMKCLKLGGKVMVVAPNRAAFDRLVEIVSKPEKLFLAVEPPAGSA